MSLWPSLGENEWPTLGENKWTSLGENGWPILGENLWPIIARKMTSNFDPLLPVERTLHLPVAELLQPGYSWEGSSYEIGVGGGMNDVVYHWNEVYAVTAAEPVVLNGHVYDGLQITKTFTNHIEGRPYIAISYRVNELMEGTVVFTLARGVGVVQATTTYTLVDLTEPFAEPSSPQVNEISLTEFYVP